MHLRTTAIVLASRPHGEHGAVVRALTEHEGLQPGYVRGGRSRQMRPILQPGNVVLGEWRARSQGQLPALAVEMVESRGALHAQPLPALALAWITALVAATLPEAQPYPRLFRGLAGLIDAITAAPAARGWAAALVRFELLLLAELGFGLDLERCVVTGSGDDLAFVSPRSGGAVSRKGAAGYEERLLPLPRFLGEGGMAEWEEVFAAASTTGHFLRRDLLTERHADGLLSARARLFDRLRSAVA